MTANLAAHDPPDKGAEPYRVAMGNGRELRLDREPGHNPPRYDLALVTHDHGSRRVAGGFSEPRREMFTLLLALREIISLVDRHGLPGDG